MPVVEEEVGVSDELSMLLSLELEGVQALVEAVEDAASAPESGGKADHKASDGNAAHASPDRAPRPGSKQALLVAMLSKPKGATLAQLVEATGWLPHTTRAALTGLRKRGFAIERAADDKFGSVYRIVVERTQAAT